MVAYFLVFIIILNLVLALIVIFLDGRTVGFRWVWIFILFFIPILGFVFYLLGQNLRHSQLFNWEDLKKTGTEKILETQLAQLRSNQLNFHHQTARDHWDLISMFLTNNHAIFTEENIVELFIDGQEKFDRLFKDIRDANDYIHLQYYIINNDKLGNRLIEALTQKAKEGVKVRILYDELGSRKLPKRFFKDFCLAGGMVEVFFPSKLRFINLRLNNRNHRKLVIIDGKIGYVGGFNVGDEYLGLNSRFGYWRDTHLRIQGMAVYGMQTRFILDWNQATEHHPVSYAPKLYPEDLSHGTVGIQIVTSGPDSEFEHIKNGYIKMILSAKKSIYIQTPYFIPDGSLLDALKIACLSGIEVNIMIPDKPDHPFIYWANLVYVGDLLKVGAKVYHYKNGFIHAKTIVVDEEISSVGTANIDVRSFKLNFEVNAFLYDEEISRRLIAIFQEDLKVSELYTLHEYQLRSRTVRAKESISRLFSPIL